MFFLKRLYLKYTNPVKYWRKLGAEIGNNCEMYATAYFGSEPYLVHIGNHVRINSGVQFVTHDGGTWVLRGLHTELENIDLIQPIYIGDNVHVGTNSIIMPGVNIGNNCIIGCGAIVTKDIPDNSVAVGVPARVIESIDEYYQKHAGQFIETKKMSANEKRTFLEKLY